MEHVDNEADEQRQRADYVTPALIRFGTVAEITRSQNQTGKKDGGHPGQAKTH